MSLIRTVDEKEYEDVLALSQYAFQYTLTEAQKDRKKKILEKQQIWAVYDEQNEMESKLHILPHHIWIEEQPFSMGGIAGVATWPEYRRNGNVTSLIMHALKQMKEKGQILSYLHPFKVSFYRKYGWELIADKSSYELSKEHLVPFQSVKGRIKRINIESEWELLNNVYEQFSRLYNGMLERNEFWWLHHVQSPGYHFVAALDEQQQIVGYIMYKIENKLLEVEEFISLNEQAFKILWNFICRHDSMVNQLSLRWAGDESWLFLLDNPSCKQTSLPYFMGRIVDVPAFLELYPFKKEKHSVFLHLHDEHCPWNNGTYHIINGTVTPFLKRKGGSICTHPPKRGLQLDIQTLTTALLGYRSVKQLSQMGKITGDNQEIERFAQIITQKSTNFLDFF
ncbi:MAG TPA: GNAT family N-acetyltransferase [Bacillus sp. (in: firmicutes)]|nr:GNAT family N-acetyltransferase [Bacillus sp. (in: firmicutes)]